jgi:hypothetical protein
VSISLPLNTHKVTSSASRDSTASTWYIIQRFVVEGWSQGWAGGEYYSAARSGSETLWLACHGGGCSVESYSDASSIMVKQVPISSTYTVLKKICNLFHTTPSSNIPFYYTPSYDLLRNIPNPPKLTQASHFIMPPHMICSAI